jgi:hypothetical protein
VVEDQLEAIFRRSAVWTTANGYCGGWANQQAAKLQLASKKKSGWVVLQFTRHTHRAARRETKLVLIAGLQKDH